MSDTQSRAALERMNLREVAIAPVYSSLGSDLQLMAATEPEDGQKKFMEHRRTELCEAYGFNGAVQKKPFAFANGIAIIPFSGSLINRFGQSYGFVTGYNFIARQLALALADDDVKGIVGDFNTFGGEAAGCFECSDLIFAARGKKPMIAVVDSNCMSAGYALASAFDKVVCTPTGTVGSIGVVAMHVDMSKMLDSIGYKVTFIHFGEHKVDGNSYEPLSKEVLADIQAGIDKAGDKFVKLVARNRKMDAAKVVDTQARCYRADDALALGLIDTIAAPSQAMQVFFDELSGSVHQPETEDEMSVNTETKPGTDQANAQALESAKTEARVAERARVNGILNCAEATGRESMAKHLAMNTEMSVVDAQALLNSAPVAAAPVAAPAPAASTQNMFKAAMEGTANPEVGADSGAGNGGAGSLSKAQQILQSQETFTGMKLVK